MKIRHITIRTAAFEEEIEFYKTYGAMSIQRDLRPLGSNIVFLSDAEGDTRIEVIYEPDAAPVSCDAISIGLHAENLEEMHEKVVNPSPLISPVPGVEFFFVNDPAGVRVQFVRERE